VTDKLGLVTKRFRKNPDHRNIKNQYVYLNLHKTYICIEVMFSKEMCQAGLCTGTRFNSPPGYLMFVVEVFIIIIIIFILSIWMSGQYFKICNFHLLENPYLFIIFPSH